MCNIDSGSLVGSRPIGGSAGRGDVVDAAIDANGWMVHEHAVCAAGCSHMVASPNVLWQGKIDVGYIMGFDCMVWRCLCISLARE